MTPLRATKEPCLPNHLATIFMEAALHGSTPPFDLIPLLSQMAMGPNLDLAQDASASLYGKIILPLCDDFTSHGVAVANRVLISMILDFCDTPHGKEARQILHDFQLTDHESFLARYQKLLTPNPISQEQRRAVKKVFILSRVSLGADIAITSIIIARVKKALSHAKIYLVGPNHLHHLFHNNDLHHLEIPFNREGSLLQKMAAWPRLYRLIAKECNTLAAQEILLFDPDTRLSQLGLVPLTSTSSTHYLCSRQDQAENMSQAAITNNWLDQIFPDIPASPPYFSINPALLAQCRLFSDHFKKTTFKIIINFGVAHDYNKRLADPFEEELLVALLQQNDTLIILDSGKGENEENMAKRLMAEMAKRSYNTAEFSERQLTETDIWFQHGLVRFSGKIDALAGLIKSCNLYIGYDSCGQHVATATETPSIICFTGAANKRFLGRWQPSNRHGNTTTFVIDQKPGSSEQRAELIEKIIQTAGRYRS
ncbi:MAG: hypothetical protein KKD73_08770 [Proteobacteria bacterium]|nr:hypothetical protein [Pseudomonadota bacterium]MBU1640534.1 hypothetical protein [Pseudomonadota bacterium]